jgi:hypothetical protein
MTDDEMQQVEEDDDEDDYAYLMQERAELDELRATGQLVEGGLIDLRLLPVNGTPRGSRHLSAADQEERLRIAQQQQQVQQRRRDYHQAYYRRPEVKSRYLAYRQRPEVIIRRRRARWRREARKRREEREEREQAQERLVPEVPALLQFSPQLFALLQEQWRLWRQEQEQEQGACHCTFCRWRAEQ